MYSFRKMNKINYNLIINKIRKFHNSKINLRFGIGSRGSFGGISFVSLGDRPPRDDDDEKVETNTKIVKKNDETISQRDNVLAKCKKIVFLYAITFAIVVHIICC